MQHVDVVVIGAGMAGACAAYALAGRRKVALLERETQPGYHSTGRSAALYVQTYGNAATRALTVAGQSFFASPPTGFSEHPLVTPRGSLFVGAAAQRRFVERMFEESHALSPVVRLVSGQEALRRCPVLRPDAIECALLDPAAMDIDVHALHQGFLRAARAQGVHLATSAEVTALERSGSGWRIRAGDESYTAPVVVNAAGAWADATARLAGVRPIGLQPLRRTAITFDAPDATDVAHWPAVFDIEEQWYFKPEAGRLMASPADETPSEPCDAQPEEYDVAVAAERIERMTTLRVKRLASKWAGLRSFVADHTLVAGFDPDAEGFFWLAGHGGAGIQTAPGAALAVAGLIDSGDLPPELRALGLTRDTLAPARLRA